MRLVAITSVSIVLMLSPAAAQIGNPAGNDPATRERAPGVPDARQTNVPDRLFALLISAAGMAEVDAGRLTGRKSENKSVQAFAQRMIDDHGKANAQLESLATQLTIPLA